MKHKYIVLLAASGLVSLSSVVDAAPDKAKKSDARKKAPKAEVVADKKAATKKNAKNKKADPANLPDRAGIKPKESVTPLDEQLGILPPPGDGALVAPAASAHSPKKSDIITLAVANENDKFDISKYKPTNLIGITLVPDERRFIKTNSQATVGEKFNHPQSKGVYTSHLKNIPAVDELKAKLSKEFLNKPLRYSGLEELVKMIQTHYVENGHLLVHVFVPVQQVSNRIKIAVKEGRITKVSVDPAEKEDPDGLWDKWKSWYSQPYDLDKLEADLDQKAAKVENLQPGQLSPIFAEANRSPWARLNRQQQHPFMRVSGKLRPRRDTVDPSRFVLGETEVVLSAEQERPLKFFVGYDNSLTELLGEDRLYVGGVWYDAFALNQNHQLAMQFFTSTDTDLLTGVVGSYQVPWVQQKQYTELYAAYVDTSAPIIAAGIPSTVGGSTLILGARHFFELPALVDGGEVVPGSLGYDPAAGPRPLWTAMKQTRQKFGVFHEIGAGFDYKSTDNNIEFGGRTVLGDSADLIQFVLDYNVRQTDTNGETNLSWQHFIGVGGSGDDEFEKLRTGAKASYYYTKLGVKREQDLSAGMLVKGNLMAQFATENLLQSEQMGIGGTSSVRGYAERSYRADNGLFFSMELYSPPLHPLDHFLKKKGLHDELRFLAFFDYGTGTAANEIVATDRSQSLMSVGVGLRYNVSNDINIRFDWGVPLEDLDSPPYSEEASDSRFHLGLVCTF